MSKWKLYFREGHSIFQQITSRKSDETNFDEDVHVLSSSIVDKSNENVNQFNGEDIVVW